MTEPTLRPALRNEADARFLLAVRNDPLAREVSLHREEIDWEAHWGWYEAGFEGDRRLVYIGIWGGQRIGYVRFDRTEPANAALVSIALAPDHRGRGHATPLLRTGVAQAIAAWSLERVIAEIHPDNARSIKLFERCAFVAQDARSADGFRRFSHPARRLHK